MTQTNVFFGNLPPTFFEAELNALVSSFGTIVNSTVWRDKMTQASKGFGFVQFSNPAEAAAAIEALNGVTFQGEEKPLEVRYSESPEQKAQRKQQRQATLGANRFHPYQPAGAVVPNAGRVPAVAYNKFAAPAFPAPVPVPAPAFHSGPVEIPKVNPDEPEPNSNLYVRGLSTNVDELAVYKVFGQFGAIASVRVELDLASGLPKGYGFVQYFHATDAARARDSTNLLILDGRALTVDFHKPRAR